MYFIVMARNHKEQINMRRPSGEQSQETKRKKCIRDSTEDGSTGTGAVVETITVTVSTTDGQGKYKKKQM